MENITKDSYGYTILVSLTLFLKKNNLYCYAENAADKGPYEVITFIDDYIKENKNDRKEKLVLFANNGYRQKKNRHLFYHLDNL